MDVTTTAQVVDAVKNTSGLDPATITVLSGILLSHLTKPINDRFPESLKAVKPYIIGVVQIAITALIQSAATGTPFKANLSTGLAVAGTAAVYHIAALKPNGIIAGVLNAIAANKQPK